LNIAGLNIKTNQNMKKVFSLLAMLFLNLNLFAQEQTTTEVIDSVFKKYTGWFVNFIFYEIPFSDTIRVPWVLFVLIGGALYFTITFKFVQFRLFGTAVRTVIGRYDGIDHHGSHKTLESDDQNIDIPKTVKLEGHHGEVSHFQALTAALSGTVGLGNIAGVAVAVSLGGPGATLWMIVAGLLGMAAKFAECTLGVAYRDIDDKGIVYGGPMYYISKGLKEKGFAKLGKVLAAVFAVLVIGGSFGGGNMFQANQASAQLVNLFGLTHPYSGTFIGIAMAILAALVIIGGIKRIASVTDKMVPFMAILYVGAGLIIMFMNYNLIPKAISLIFTEAFTGHAIAGGFIGALIQGFKRAAFSNEAGVGSAAIAHSAVRTRYPASEGVVSLLEPFIDTVVICTMTSVVLVIGNLSVVNSGSAELFQYGVPVSEGVELTARAFESQIRHSSIVLTIAVFLFAFSTMISWSYYGMQGWLYLFGKGKVIDMTYKILFLLFVVLGATIKLGSVLDFSDAMIFGMLIPNIIGVLFLVPRIREELAKYLKAISDFKSRS
jgi:AGCS family alanine or glycine:cation symporter